MSEHTAEKDAGASGRTQYRGSVWLTADRLPDAEKNAAIRTVQHWMASDLQSALGYEPNIDADPSFGDVGWADWWAALCDEVRALAFGRDLNAREAQP